MRKFFAALFGLVGGVFAAFAACYILKGVLGTGAFRVAACTLIGGGVGLVVGSIGGDNTRQDDPFAARAIIGFIFGALAAGLVAFFYNDAWRLLNDIGARLRIGG